MPRIVSGRARGRRLTAPDGDGTRPTSDRAREGLFSALEAQRGSWRGAHVLDLFAGSGAVGLEASSRGAASVVLVERDPKALKALRANVETVLNGTTADERRTHVIQVAAVSVESFVGAPGSRFDVVFADPPYAMPAAELASLLDQLARAGGLAPEAVVVVERATRDDGWAWPPSITALRERAYGEATLWYGRAAAVAEDTSGSDPRRTTA